VTEDESKRVESSVEAKAGETNASPDRPVRWLDVLKAVAIPLVTLVLGFVFNNSLNTRQAKESNVRLYTEMMGRREQADSDLRKDMFKSILDTFMQKNTTLKRDELLDQEVLNLELLADNFHESLDLAPLFKHVRRRIPEQEEGPNAELRKRLEKVAQEVVGRQLTIISDNGMVESGETLLQNVSNFQAYLYFGAHYVPDPNFKPGEGVSRLCMSLMDTGDKEQHYRQFKLEVTDYDPHWREVQVRLYASRVLDQAACESADLDLAGNKEIDTRFWVGLFDFPMIDNTHLTHDERCAVSVTELTPPYNLKVALAYFPGSRASLKDKPYYDDLIHDLVSGQASPGGGGH
jgi:hypothetical protein